jgi:hypothetical protein
MNCRTQGSAAGLSSRRRSNRGATGIPHSPITKDPSVAPYLPPTPQLVLRLSQPAAIMAVLSVEHPSPLRTPSEGGCFVGRATTAMLRAQRPNHHGQCREREEGAAVSYGVVPSCHARERPAWPPEMPALAATLSAPRSAELSHAGPGRLPQHRQLTASSPSRLQTARRRDVSPADAVVGRPARGTGSRTVPME